MDGMYGPWFLLLLFLIYVGVLYIISKISTIGKKVSMYIVLLTIVIIMVFPFYAMIVMASHSTPSLFSFPPPLWFGDNLMVNFRNMISVVNMPRAFMNSLIVSVSFTTLSLLFCSIGGYAFATYQFPGRNVIFTGLLITMMVPWTAGLIPWFLMMSRFGWINTFWALIIPGSASAFGIFWMRQYCMNHVPTSLKEAAKIDGCSEWLIFFRIIAPILKPAYAALGIMQFVGVWNDFMTPLLILRQTRLHTLPLLLRFMQGDVNRGGTDVGLMMLASTVVILPLLIVFFCASKMFMSGLTAGALKE